MTAQEGIKEIDTAEWVKDEWDYLLLTVHDANGRDVVAMLSLRPHYCDRGHIQLNIEGHLDLDSADSFPRFFFSFEEANLHVRTFLKWRLWKHRTHAHKLEVPQDGV
jgi:hypothetical protein